MKIRSLMLASLALVGMTSASFATTFCRDAGIRVTPDNAPVERTGFHPGSDPGFTPTGNMTSILGVCKNPDHEWYESWQRDGKCIPNGYELETMATPVTGGETFIFVTLDGVVPDVPQIEEGELTKDDLKDLAKDTAKVVTHNAVEAIKAKVNPNYTPNYKPAPKPADYATYGPAVDGTCN